jgi:peptidoglycan hydrolase CwlO-like protein|tara:strand:- start:1596 stop:1760 length:165 start_codon:yes stop_codon:yes gene_type:complete
MFNTSIYIITGTKMNIDKKIQELEKQIKYIESVLKEKQDELFCLKAEKKGHKAP